MPHTMSSFGPGRGPRKLSPPPIRLPPLPPPLPPEFRPSGMNKRGAKRRKLKLAEISEIFRGDVIKYNIVIP